MTYLVDTNVLLRLFLRDDRIQGKKAEKIFKTLLKENHTLFIDPLVIIEFLFVSMSEKYHVSKEQCVHFLSTIIQYENIETVDKQVLLNSLKLFQEKTIDFVDCYLFIKAQNDSGRVLSFDRHFDSLNKTIRLEPPE